MSAQVVTLSDEQLEQLADLIADRLRSTPASSSPEIVSAAELAVRLSIDVKTVYRHAEAFGGVRAGRRLRFDLNRALEVWSAGESARDRSERSQTTELPASTGRRTSRRRASTGDHCQLLPVGRRKAGGEHA